MLSLILLELTVREVIADLPRDGGAVVVFLLVLATVGFIWHGSRGGRNARRSPSSDASEDPRRSSPAAGSGREVAPDPKLEPVVFEAAALSTAPEVRRLHTEVK